MIPSTPPNDSGSAAATAREKEPTSAGAKGTRGGRNSGRGRGNGQEGPAEDAHDGMECRRGGWKGRGSRGRGGARPAVARDRPTHFLSLPLHTHADLRDRISAFQNALFSPPSPSTLDSPPIVAQPSTVKGKRPLRVSSIVDGLDSSIVIDPRRLHMTLGVMALQKEPAPPATDTDAVEEQAQVPLRPTMPISSTPTSTGAPANSDPDTTRPPESLPSQPNESDVSPPQEPAEPPRTVTTALALLRSLQPQISAILDGSRGVHVPLEVMDVLKTTRISAPKARDANAVPKNDGDGDPPVAADTEEGGSKQPEPEPEPESDPEPVEKVGAGVLFVGPKHVARAEEDDERRKLREVSELVHRAFRDAGYITEQRPLKLHCTILNASHRKPARRAPFAYTDVLAASSACALLGIPPPISTISTIPTIPIVDEEAQDSALEVEDVSMSVAAPDSPLPPPPSPTSVHLNAKRHSFSSAARVDVIDVPCSNSDGTRPPAHTVPTTSDVSPPHPLIPIPAATPQAKANDEDEGRARPRHRPPVAVPPPRAIALGTYRVGEVQLWVMGSHGRRGEYVSCGGVRLE